jgi:biopolymer transport protein ExbB/TolQ
MNSLANDVVTWGAVAVAIGALIAIIKLSNFYSDRITKAQGSAKVAAEIAQEARKDAHDTAEKIALLSASFGLYCEQIARDYVHREVMREVEDRLTSAINGLGERLDRFTAAALQGKHL